MTEQTIGKKQLRSFGLMVAIVFSVFGLWPLVFRGESPRTFALAIAFLSAVAALAFPLALRPVLKVWMMFGEALGWLNTRIILTVIYYGLIVPIGVYHRRGGKDSMSRQFDRAATTYGIPRSKRPASHMQRQY